MQFLDQVKIHLKSGWGGDGCVSFRREKCVEFGGPDGGNGGRGGDIIFQTTPDSNTLIDFRYRQHFRAERGHHGRGKNCTGACGKDLLVCVPIGTELRLDDEGRTLVADLTDRDQKLILLKGGDGGRGNASYKSSTNRAPRQFQAGFPGQELSVWLRLKLLADIGLLGLPNAGKSSLLNQITNTRVKTGDYPFTTLRPQLGVLSHQGQECVLADIPGLIEGAVDGVGLGDRFLGHIERCSLLVHLVDGSVDDPITDYHLIREEIMKYGSGLPDKPCIVAMNKTDCILEDDLLHKKAALEDVCGMDVMMISAINGEGLKPLCDLLLLRLQEAHQSRDAALNMPAKSWSPV